MKVSVLMPVYNCDVTLGEALESIYPFVDEIIISEGAWNPDSENIRSTDKTISIIDKFAKDKNNVKTIEWNPIDPKSYPTKCQDHKNRLSIQYHPYYNYKALVQQMMCRDTMMNMSSGDWIWLVDADEIFNPEDTKKLIKFLETEKEHHLLTIKSMVFYFDSLHYASERFRRLFRKLDGMYCSDDNSFDTETIKYDNYQLDLDESIIKCFHYSYLGDFRVEKKLEMWDKESADWWLEHVWKEKNIGKILIENCGGYHLFARKNPCYGGYKLQKFNGIHPDIVKDKMESFVNRFNNG